MSSMLRVVRRRPNMISGLAHTAVHVADVEAAVAWYRDVLGMTCCHRRTGWTAMQITADMGELVPSPVVGEGRDRRVARRARSRARSHRVPERRRRGRERALRRCSSTTASPTSRLVCDDVAATRRALEAKGVRVPDRRTSPTSPACARPGSRIRGGTCSSCSRSARTRTAPTSGSTEPRGRATRPRPTRAAR